jgi:elongation factor 3
VSPYLTPYLTVDEAATVTKGFMEKCFQESRAKVKIEDEEDEGEDLCNCEFSLAYGA